VSTQSFDNFNLLVQFQQSTRNLAVSMRNNAQTHKSMAAAQVPSLSTLAGFVNTAAQSYLDIMSTMTTCTNNNVPQTTAALQIIGATPTDLTNYMSTLQTAANNLKSASKTTYAQISAACDNLLTTVTAPAAIYGS
jgi:hypothetical protein